MAMTTGVLPCSCVLLPPSKSLNSFPLSITDGAKFSWVDITNGNFRSMLYSGVRYERAKKFRASVFSSSPAGDLRPEINENPEGILSGEWPENFSLLSYDDLRAYLETQIASEKMKPSALLGEVMSTPIRTATADQTLEEVDHHFEIVSGLPVIDENLKCIGVISRKDKAKASNGLKSKVGEVMSSPAVTLSPEKTLLDAAALMLKKKVHRIPILNEKQQVVGIVTRTDVFQLKSKVGEVMSSPAVTLSPEKTLLDAAALMLKKKVHRIPILNEKQQVVGIVTRTDVFQVLEASEA